MKARIGVEEARLACRVAEGWKFRAAPCTDFKIAIPVSAYAEGAAAVTAVVFDAYHAYYLRMRRHAVN